MQGWLVIYLVLCVKENILMLRLSESVTCHIEHVSLFNTSYQKEKEGFFVAALFLSALCHVTRTAVVDGSILEYQEGKEQWLLWIINWPCCGL